MASITKFGKSSYRIQYYLNGKRMYKTLPTGTPKDVIKAVKKEIESKVALHKAGIKKFVEEEGQGKVLTIAEMTGKVLEIRKDEVCQETQNRNGYAMKLYEDSGWGFVSGRFVKLTT